MKLWIFRWGSDLVFLKPPYQWEMHNQEECIVPNEDFMKVKCYGIVIGNSFFGYQKVKKEGIGNA